VIPRRHTTEREGETVKKFLMHSREDAERLLEGCPIITSVRLYEAMAM
jgi:hypothetical protein